MSRRSSSRSSGSGSRRDGQGEAERRSGQRRSERSEGRVVTRWVARLVQGARRKGASWAAGQTRPGTTQGEE